jgi:hypothetical protein
MDPNISNLLARTLKELESRKDRPLGTLWDMTFFLESEEVVKIKVFLQDLDRMVQSFEENSFVMVKSWDSTRIINTEKIIHVHIKEEGAA